MYQPITLKGGPAGRLSGTGLQRGDQTQISAYVDRLVGVQVHGLTIYQMMGIYFNISNTDSHDDTF